jgi:hypothetical protein
MAACGRTIGAIVLLCCATRVGLAQTAADRETARLLMDRADEQIERGEYESALDLYRGAHEIMHVPTTGIEVARAYEKLGKLVEARDAAVEVLRMPHATDEPAPFKAARDAADQLARSLSEQMPSLRLEIHPPEATSLATLSIDGARVPLAAVGLSYALNPSDHRLNLSVPGFHSVEQRITLVRGEHRTLRLDLTPMPTVARLETRTTAPVVPASGLASDQGKTQNASGRTALSWPAWVGIGLSAAGLGVGTVAGIVSLERASAAKSWCQGNACSPNARSDRDAALVSADVSNVGFAVGLVGAAVFATSIWLSHADAPRANRAALRLGVSATPSGGTVRLSGALW